MSRKETIHDKLVDTFSPTALEVLDESHMHSVPKGAESHFKVVVVSDKFDGHALVARHRMINEALKDELAAGLHALSIFAYTSQQWQKRGGEIPASPPCRGGSKAG